MSDTLPEAFAVPDFDALLEDYKAAAVDYVAEQDEDTASELSEALDNDSELLAQITQAFVLKRQSEIREQNYWARQMFRKYVTESDMIDLLALQYNLQRQTITAADTSVFPPTEAVMESDESLLKRFDLAPYQFHTTGTRKGYKFHALTLGERPVTTIETEDSGDVVMRFSFPDVTETLVKDAEVRMLTPNSGDVEVAILSRESDDGQASDALLQSVSDYLNRDDIAQESDTITTKSATITTYAIEATLYTGGDPAHAVTEADAIAAVQEFADQHHRLNQRVDRLELGNVLYGLNPLRVELNAPAADVICDWDAAPYCTGVTIHVSAEQ
ncbi:baseplate J/gp47 family protein [Celerinatantimonas sp. MCCC 1A17872]|uniref:baseplate J/gp47 family protein n=1 Tax=Celerinatantimonas sp. MCCC 1A17872 TaxID=3177514 RepID=UPI0038C6EA1B